MSDLIAEAIDLAERGASNLRFYRPDGKYASEELYEAWDLLNAAAKCVDEAKRRAARASPNRA